MRLMAVLRPRPVPPAPASEMLLRVEPPAAGEDRLGLAVLLDAVAVLREHATGIRPHRPDLIAGTVRWFTVPDAGWRLSFGSICRALGLDPADLLAAFRRELAALGAPGLLSHPRPRVVPFRMPQAPPARLRAAGAPHA